MFCFESRYFSAPIETHFFCSFYVVQLSRPITFDELYANSTCLYFWTESQWDVHIRVFNSINFHFYLLVEDFINTIKLMQFSNLNVFFENQQDYIFSFWFYYSKYINIEFCEIYFYIIKRNMVLYVINICLYKHIKYICIFYILQNDQRKRENTMSR